VKKNTDRFYVNDKMQRQTPKISVSFGHLDHKADISLQPKFFNLFAFTLVKSFNCGHCLFGGVHNGEYFHIFPGYISST